MLPGCRFSSSMFTLRALFLLAFLDFVMDCLTLPGWELSWLWSTLVWLLCGPPWSACSIILNCFNFNLTLFAFFFLFFFFLAGLMITSDSEMFGIGWYCPSLSSSSITWPFLVGSDLETLFGFPNFFSTLLFPWVETWKLNESMNVKGFFGARMLGIKTWARVTLHILLLHCHMR